MYLNKLEIIGFKSFARKTVLEFPSKKGDNFSVTAVVGPNGSGKSNLLEAIRWALGEQSLKSLRGKKSQDIIFSGSLQKTRLNLAEVTLFFNNEDKSAPIDYQEFTITRRLYRNGESDYLLNKNSVRLQDILILLAKSNFGQKSYSIVSQGLVDQILQTLPAERKKFFDEATGIKQYQIKKDGALKKIFRSQENLKQAQIALTEISPHLRSLTRQINKLSQRQKIEEKLFQHQKEYYGSQWHELKNKTNQLKAVIDQKKQAEKKIEQELKELREESESLVEETPDQEYQKLQEQYQKIIDEKNKFITAQSIIQAKLNFEKEIQETRPTKIALKINPEIVLKNLEEIAQDQNNLLNKIEHVSQLKEVKNLQTLTQKIITKIRHCLEYFKNEKEDKKEEKKEPSQALIKKLKEDYSQSEKKVKELEKKQTELREKINQFNETERGKRQEILNWQKKIQEKQLSLNELSHQINDKQIDLAKIETKQEILDQDIIEDLGPQGKEIIKNTKGFSLNQEDDKLEKIHHLKHQLDLIGSIDPEITKEYPQIKERHDFLTNQSEDLIKTIKSLNKIIQELDQKIKNQFEGKFKQINQKFDRYFQIIFGGGHAKINFLKANQSSEQDNSEEKDEINILANPPGKKIKNIEMLSGGEKALTSLALICSIISINKPPFVVLDEVDAALDQENSFRFAKIIHELRQNTQFIVITHNQQTIEISDILYGITMGSDGISKLISLKLE